MLLACALRAAADRAEAQFNAAGPGAGRGLLRRAGLDVLDADAGAERSRPGPSPRRRDTTSTSCRSSASRTSGSPSSAPCSSRAASTSSASATCRSSTTRRPAAADDHVRRPDVHRWARRRPPTSSGRCGASATSGTCVDGTAAFFGIIGELKYNKVSATPGERRSATERHRRRRAGPDASASSAAATRTATSRSPASSPASRCDDSSATSSAPSSTTSTSTAPSTSASIVGVQGGYRSLVADYLVDDDSGDLKMKGSVLRRPGAVLGDGTRALPRDHQQRAADRHRHAARQRRFPAHQPGQHRVDRRRRHGDVRCRPAAPRNGRSSRCATRTASISGNSDANRNETRSARSRLLDQPPRAAPACSAAPRARPRRGRRAASPAPPASARPCRPA